MLDYRIAKYRHFFPESPSGFQMLYKADFFPKCFPLYFTPQIILMIFLSNFFIPTQVYAIPHNLYISKNSGLHSERPVHQTHRTPERQSRIRTQPWYHTTHQTQPNAAPKTQDAPDAAPKTQDTPDAAPNTQDAT